MEQLPELDPYNISRIEEYLKGKNLPINDYRSKVGKGRSQCFGMVRKRSLPADISRLSWLDPYLHHLLMEFGRMHVPIPFTSVQVNQNYMCQEHVDANNSGQSYIIGFGSYQGGDLTLDLSGVKTSINIRYKPILFEGWRIPHKTEEWTGNRYTIVYHTFEPHPKFPPVHSLKNYEAVSVNGKWKLSARYPGQEVIYLDSKAPLPHPLLGRKVAKKPLSSEEPKIVPGMTAAQNLLLQAMGENCRV
jgi:hypothetical protein